MWIFGCSSSVRASLFEKEAGRTFLRRALAMNRILLHPHDIIANSSSHRGLTCIRRHRDVAQVLTGDRLLHGTDVGRNVITTQLYSQAKGCYDVIHLDSILGIDPVNDLQEIATWFFNHNR